MTVRLARLLNPRRIAFIGGRWARIAAAQCLSGGFDGEVVCVNAQGRGVAGAPVVAAVGELAASPPDAAFVAVNRHQAIETIGELAAMGCGGVVCFAAGFRETGDDDLHRQLLAATGEMPLLGPNCYGFLNYLDGALLWPDQHGGARLQRGVAIISQSGNIAINVTMQQRGVPVAFVCTIGNQAQIGFAELTQAFLDDERVSAIGWVMESGGDAAALETVLRAARGKKPVVVLKLGASEQGAAVTLSHTASLAGGDAAADAFFRRMGVGRAPTLPSFMEALKLLHCVGPLSGRAITAMSCSGGEAALMADRIALRRLQARPFSAEETARIRPLMNDLVTVGNPFDYHTFVWGDSAQLRAVYEAVLACRYDLSLLVLDFPRADRCVLDEFRQALDAFCLARAQVGGAAAVVATFPENMPEAMVAVAEAHDVCCFAGVEEALDAAQAAADIGEAWRQPPPSPSLAAVLSASPSAGARYMFDEAAGKALLRDAGVAVPPTAVVRDGEDWEASLAALPFPLAVKVLGVAHKSDVGGVRLNCRDAAAVRRAMDDMLPLGDRFLVEAMQTNVVAELLVGVRRDPLAGLLLTVGMGGVWTEILTDVGHVVLPTDEAAVRRVLDGLRGAAVWRGGRGGAAVNEDALVATILRIAEFAETRAATLLELDINPLFLRADGAAVAADVLLVESARQCDGL